MSDRSMPGLNIQWPWSRLIVEGKKTIETRSYPLPAKFIGVKLAVIETSGPMGRKLAGINKAQIIGTVTFASSFQYSTKKLWLADYSKHCVKPDDPNFMWTAKPKFGWIINEVSQISKPVPPPDIRGIIFARDCSI